MKRLISILLVVSVLLTCIVFRASGTGAPGIPVSVKATYASCSSIKLSWSAVAGANGYMIAMYNRGSKKYSNLKETTATSYTISGLSTNVIYSFKVAAFTTVSGVKVYGAYSASVSAKPILGTPGWVKASAASPRGYTKVSWQGVNGATGYVVYRSTSSTKGFSTLKVTSATSYTVKGTLYFYKVAAYRTVNKVNVYGTSSAAFSTPEISTSGLTSKMPGAKILQAWKIVNSGTSVVVQRLSYGSAIKATYQGKTYTMPQTCFLAIVTCKPANFRNTCASLTLNTDEALVNDMAKKTGAIVAINDEAYNNHWNPDPHQKATFVCTGPVVKESQVVQNSKNATYTGQAFYKDGTWVKGKSICNANVKKEIANGLYFTQYSVIPVIWDGKIRKKFGTENVIKGSLHNRTMFGQIDSTHYLLMAGEFMQQDSMITILAKYGARKAYICNGGNCSYMYLKGVGNVTGTTAPQLVNLDKMNVLEQEWLGSHNLIGGGKGAACPAIDIIYVK